MSGKRMLRREEPPPVGRRAGSVDWPTMLVQITAANGDWVRVRDYPTLTTAATSVYRVRHKYDADGKYEFTTRTVEGRGVVYARLKPSP